MELPPQVLGKIPASKRVEFVRAGETENLPSPAEVAAEGVLSGPEARSFYEKIISGPSTSKIKQEVMEDTNYDPTLVKRIKKVKKQPDNEFDMRDVNRFLRAATEGDIKTIKEMLGRGLNVDSRDDFGWTALMCAAVAGNLSAARALLTSGADWYALDYTDKNVFDLLHQKKKFDVSEALQGLVEEVLNPEVYTIEDETMNYCDVCKKKYSSSGLDHLASTTHILLSAKEGTKYPGYMIPSANIGYRLLKDNGWNEEQGLGKEGTGTKFPIRTVLKGDRAGFGSNNAAPRVTHFEPRDLRAVESIKAISSREQKEAAKQSQRRRENLARDFQQTWSDRDFY